MNTIKVMQTPMFFFYLKKKKKKKKNRVEV